MIHETISIFGQNHLCRTINTGIAFITLKLKPAMVKQVKDEGVRGTEIGSIFCNR